MSETLNITITASRMFTTEAEALAFVEGLEFVNDSALSWTGPQREEGEGGWWVHITDRDNPEKAPPVVVALRIVGGKIEPIYQAPFTLDWLQAEVGGYIETALTNAMGGHDRITVWCNDEGHIHGLPSNVFRCTDGHPLVGPLVVTGCDREGNERPLTPAEVRAVRITDGVLYLDEVTP